jgi:phosphopantothenate synthetase
MLGILSRITLPVISVNGNCTIYAPSPKGLTFVTEARCAVEHFVQTLVNSMKGDFAMYGIH